MTQAKSERVAGVAIAALFTATAGGMLATAYTYSKASSLLPRFTGWIFLILALTETVIQVRRLLAVRGDATGASDVAAAEAHLRQQRLRGVKGFLWIAVMLLLLYVAGFLVATPLFIFTFLRISAGETAMRSAIVAAGATAVIWLGFVELLDYKLYPGVLFR